MAFDVEGIDSVGDDNETGVVASAPRCLSESTAARGKRRRLAELARRVRERLTYCTADTSQVHVPLDDTIRDAVVTRAQKPTRVGLICRT